MAVISYRQVLFAEGYEAALDDHFLWGYMLLVVMVFGPGQDLARPLARAARGARQLIERSERDPCPWATGMRAALWYIARPLQGSPRSKDRRGPKLTRSC